MKLKYKSLYFLVTGLISIIIILSFQLDSKTFAETNSINISTTPDSVLFDVNNMKPGDWAEREITIQNRGEEDFQYYMEVNHSDGSEKLFNAMIFEVYDAEEQLYKGKLMDFSSFDSRFLQAEHEEDLMMRVEFPSELGNEYQGLEVEVQFIFYYEQQSNDNEGPVDPGSNPKEEPPKGSDNNDESTDPGKDNDSTDPDSSQEEEPPTDSDDKDGSTGDESSGDGSDHEDDSTAPSPRLENQRPIDPETLDDEVKEGQILPTTAKNNFNLLLVGVALVTIGLTFYLYHRRKNSIIEYPLET